MKFDNHFCDNLFDKSVNCMWVSLTIVLDEFDDDFFAYDCSRIKFCVIQFCLLWKSMLSYG